MANESLLTQIKISEVSQGDVSDILRVAGQIDFDEQALTRIGASVTGRVTQINAQLGNEVKKGDTLALINSSELSNSQLAYLKARSEKEFHRRTVQRAKTLFEADVISAAELQRRESEYEVASAQTRAAQDQLRVLGVNLKAMEELATIAAMLDPEDPPAFDSDDQPIPLPVRVQTALMPDTAYERELRKSLHAVEAELFEVDRTLQHLGAYGNGPTIDRLLKVLTPEDRRNILELQAAEARLDLARLKARRLNPPPPEKLAEYAAKVAEVEARIAALDR